MHRRQFGFSLIELMVAMLIGVFLVFVVISSYTGSKASNEFRAEQGELEANARIAMAFLRDGIEHAGYPSTYVHFIDKPFLTAIDGNVSGLTCAEDGTVSLQAASYINNNNRYTKDNGNTDRISIAFMPDNPNDSEALYWQDCAGSYGTDVATSSVQAEKCSSDPIVGQGNDAVVYNSYFISGAQLKCSSSRNVTVPIASGVEAIQYRYGVRISGNTVYQNATTVETNQTWSNVVSVQIAILMRSNNEVFSENEQRIYMLLDRKLTKNDRYLRKVYTSTVHLVNVDRA